jgi:hypothetical protein
MKLLLLFFAINFLFIDSYKDFRFNSQEMQLIAYQLHCTQLGIFKSKEIDETFDLTSLDIDEIQRSKAEIVQYYYDRLIIDTTDIGNNFSSCDYEISVNIDNKLKMFKEEICLVVCTNNYLNDICNNIEVTTPNAKAITYYIFFKDGRLLDLKNENEKDVIEKVINELKGKTSPFIVASSMIDFYTRWSELVCSVIKDEPRFKDYLDNPNIHTPFEEIRDGKLFISYCFVCHNGYFYEVEYTITKDGKVEIKRKDIEIEY